MRCCYIPFAMVLGESKTVAVVQSFVTIGSQYITAADSLKRVSSTRIQSEQIARLMPDFVLRWTRRRREGKGRELEKAET